ncbi:hypothetical protein BST95_07625 [Halioglobus japonicus]|uniref:Diguanylate cyclase n=2 Tax=Halioglobus TaxID=1217416 RepID=A0AAP8ME20_9GAMM|nr:diguanylate cyclase response regulator [Halioglobus japonicus]AQA18130.1 hypothetical protein BST95_07625 [Halioglobus japonicus]PLW86125.1 hypothetical protein C0029_06660 [Halioglobus japonicus]GHD14347.1 hypothetical protein GCM10007052_17980 [Halioglobus japonicus]
MLTTPTIAPAIRRILVAEDNLADAELIKEMLNRAFPQHLEACFVTRLDDTLAAIERNVFDILLLDLGLPDHQGVDKIDDISNRVPALPIVVLTGNEDDEVAAWALRSGAQDYLPKSQLSPELLSRGIRYAVERKEITQRLQEELERTAEQNELLACAARYDCLTGLPNRLMLQEVGERAIKQARRRKHSLALMFLDLNGFKLINDSYGHDVGDELLKGVASRLNSLVRQCDLLARLGGDEFVILTDILQDLCEVKSLTKRIEGAFDEPFRVGEIDVTCRPAIGIATYPECPDLPALLRYADRAMYKQKKYAALKPTEIPRGVPTQPLTRTVQYHP